MSHVGDSMRSRSGPGVLPLQDHGFDGRGEDQDERLSITGVRIVGDRTPDATHVYQDKSVGDLLGGFLWHASTLGGARETGAWMFAAGTVSADLETLDERNERELEEIAKRLRRKNEGWPDEPPKVDGGGTPGKGAMGGGGGGGAAANLKKNAAKDKAVHIAAINKKNQAQAALALMNGKWAQVFPGAGAVGNVPNVFGLGVQALFPKFVGGGGPPAGFFGIGGPFLFPNWVFPKDPGGNPLQNNANKNADVAKQATKKGADQDKASLAYYSDVNTEAPIVHQVFPVTGKQIADQRFRWLRPSLPKHWPNIPRGTRGILLPATDEGQQVDLWYHADPRLVSPNFHGPSMTGTPVADMDALGGMDGERQAPIQSQWRVIKAPTGDDGMLARNKKASEDGSARNWLARTIGPSGQWDTCGGLVMDVPTGKGTISRESRILAMESIVYGGPFDVGHFGDKHVIGQDEDGTPINSLHISTDALFKVRGNVFLDGPLFFETEYPNPGELDEPIKVHLGYDFDTNLWKWWTTAIAYVPDGTITPVPHGPPPDPPPREPPKTPPTGGGGKEPPMDGQDARDRARRERERKRRETDNGGNHIISADASLDRLNLIGAAVNREVATLSLSFRPQPIVENGFDWRYSKRARKDDREERDRTAPLTLRLESFGAQGGPAGGTYLDAPSDWIYTQSPGASIWPGGTGNGGYAWTVPELTLADIDSAFAPDGVTLSTAYLVATPGVCYGAGVPELSTGGLRDGHSWCEEDGDLNFYAHDNVGTKTLVSAIGPTGAKLNVVTKGANHSVLPGEDVILVTAVVTITLPAALNNEGRPISVKVIAPGVTATVNTDGGNLEGSASQFIEEYDGISCVSDGTDWWVAL